MFQTFPDGRTFKLSSTTGNPHLYVLDCLGCGERWLMSRKPKDDQGNTLIPLYSKEAKEFVERFTTDGVFSDVDDPEPAKT